MAVKFKTNKPNYEKPTIDERKVTEFIDKGSQHKQKLTNKSDHRMILRIPRWLLEKLDEKRSERVGTLSRNSLILEYIERCTSEMTTIENTRNSMNANMR